MFKKHLKRVVLTLSPNKQVLVIKDANWGKMDWESVFGASVWLHVLYNPKYIHFGRICEIGRNSVSSSELPEVTSDSYRSVSFKGYRLWEMAKAGIFASLESIALSYPPSEREMNVVKFYYQNVCWMIAGSRNVLEQKKPHTILLCQGCTPMSRPIVEVGRDMGINVVATEGAFVRDYFFCDNATGMILNRHKASRLAGDWLPSRTFTESESKAFKVFIGQTVKHKRREHVTGDNDDCEENVDIRRRLNITADKKVAVFIGQVMTDASIVMDSSVFPDPVSLIIRLSDFFRKRQDWCFVIRLHPKEKHGASWANSSSSFGPPPGEKEGRLHYDSLTLKRLLVERPYLRQYAFVIDGTGINTALILEEADLGVTINSQAGFEMALKHKRVVVCGDAFYARKGFTYDVARPEALEATMEKACGATVLMPEEVRRIDQFGRYLFDSVLFRRDLKGNWARFLSCIEGTRPYGLRSSLHRIAARYLENEYKNRDLYFSRKDI